MPSAWFAYHGDPFRCAGVPFPLLAGFIFKGVVIGDFGEADARVFVEVFWVVGKRRTLSRHCVCVNLD